MKSSASEATAAPARRLVREAVIQLLHSVSTNPDSSADPWPLILAQLEASITRARARAALHLQQNRPKRASEVRELSPNALPLIEAYLDSSAASKNLRKLVENEEKVATALDVLRREIRSSKESDTLIRTLERIGEHNQESLELIGKLLSLLSPPNTAPQPLRPLAHALPPLLDSARTLRTILHDTKLPEIPELDALRKALATRDQIKNDALTLHALIQRHLEETDHLIAAQLQHFTPDRLNQVDRAILRLATTELRHLPAVPSAVAINEAIEIARRFGDTESPAFVNGVLEQLKPAESAN